ncbi:MAG: hypothetical protein P4L93_05655 [Coriobacteriia bacterium]|nr:hypothetical protein [Coriobacteriia bacterium]
MTTNADKTDSYISMVLGLNGRVRPADLQTLPEDARQAALSAYLEAHAAEKELCLVRGELVAGAAPDPGLLAPPPLAVSASAPSAPSAISQPADLTADGRSAIDLLLGDYDGVAPTAAAPERASQPPVGPPPASAARLSAGQSGPNAPVTPADDSDIAERPAVPREKRSYVWLLWWIPTLALPLVGGGAAWFFLRRKRVFAARAMLAAGIATGLFLSVVWLNNAERLAAINDQRNATAVIVIPSK